MLNFPCTYAACPIWTRDWSTLHIIINPEPRLMEDAYHDLKNLHSHYSRRKEFWQALYAKVGSQETPGVTGNFGLEIRNEAGQRLIEFCQENALVIIPSSNNTREDSIHGHHQIVNTEIRLIMFFAAKDGEALYSQQKQDQELTVAQIMNSLLPNSDSSWRKKGKSLDHSGMT